ncbi:MAG: DUF4159 domain-containing protein [Myxococcales bacterium]|nr:DUF4159 domain-containing protein [Myxococcales bacterium]MCB9755547.1 DUF4159 domain-containing protein [Myxococcales bacterium]
MAVASTGLGRRALAAQDPLSQYLDDRAALTTDVMGEVLRIDLPQLRYPGAWDPRPGAMQQLASELRLRTRLEPVREPTTVTATSRQLFDTPFLYVAGMSGMPTLGPEAEGQLRRFVDLGGLLVFDAADGGVDLQFERDVREMLTRVLPGSLLTRVARDHVLFRSFYIVDEPAGRTRTFDHVLGIQEEGRLKVLLLRNDLGGALARKPDGLPAYPCTPGGPIQREWAIRFAVNILLYATCTDYKSDRAHVETLLQSRNWR